MGDETEAKEFDEQSGEDEGEALAQAGKQEKRGESEQPARDHQEVANQSQGGSFERCRDE